MNLLLRLPERLHKNGLIYYRIKKDHWVAADPVQVTIFVDEVRVGVKLENISPSSKDGGIFQLSYFNGHSQVQVELYLHEMLKLYLTKKFIDEFWNKIITNFSGELQLDLQHYEYIIDKYALELFTNVRVNGNIVSFPKELKVVGSD